jgi:hypothetical protein
MNNYIICIPSYERANICNEKTLNMLFQNNIAKNKIYVYVANHTEFNIYKKILDPKKYYKIIVGKKGLVNQKQFIIDQWEQNKHIIFIDDDIQSIDLSLSDLFKSHTLDYFFKYAFIECQKKNAYIWGVYPVFNPYFRKGRKEISTELNFIVGCVYGIINRPKLQNIKLTITKENSQKEDVERTLKYFIHDGIVIRFNKIGFVTKYYGVEGGLGNFEDRISSGLKASKKLKDEYPEYGNIKIRKNGMAEFVLKKIKSETTFD